MTKVKREFSSGGVVFRQKEGQTHWLVTKHNPEAFKKSLHTKDTWRLPKGWLDDEGEGIPGPLARGEKKATQEDLEKTALKEVEEEGGVKAIIVTKVGTMRFFFNSTRGKVLKFVSFFLMEWEKDLPEGFHYETEQIAWLSYKEARERLTYQEEKEMLDKADKLISSGIQ